MTAIYLSASSRETPRARAIRDLLRSEGVEVVGGEWIEAVEAHGSLGLRLPQDERERIGGTWLDAIRRASVLLALVPHEGVSVGLIHELGIARGLGRPVVLSSKTPPERLHPALLAPGWLVYGDDVTAAWAAIQMARRAA